MQANTRSPRRLAAGAALALAAAATLTVSGVEPTPARVELRAISSRLDGQVTTVLIEASDPVAYVTSQPDPLTVLVDLRNVRASGLTSPVLTGPLPPVTSVDVEDSTLTDGTAMTRVRVRLNRPASHRVRSSRNLIYVEIDRETKTPVLDVSSRTPVHNDGSETAILNTGSANPRAERTSRTDVPNERLEPTSRTDVENRRGEPTSKTAVEHRGGSAAAATALRTVRTLPLENGLAIALIGDGRLAASSVEEARHLPPRLLLDFHNISARGVPAVTEVNQGDVERVRVGVNSRTPLITRVVIDLARRLAYRLEQGGIDGEELRVLFERTPEPASAAVAAGPPVPGTGGRQGPAVETPAAPLPVRDETPVLTNADGAQPDAVVAAGVSPSLDVTGNRAPGMAEPARVAAAVSQQQTPAQPVAPPPPEPAQQPPPPQPGTRFTGTPVTLDFQGADLRAVLRTFAEISGLNIVIDPTIQGTVDVSLRDVPWDQALDIILRANKLGYSIEGTIVRIVPLTVLAQEEEERRKLAEAQALAGELRVLTIPLSYAKAPELVSILTRSALSARGEVQVDTRTNTLIIRDLPDRLTTAAELVKALDRPQPQVEIEARIVQTNRDFARAIGVQWGFSGRMDPTLGNTTGLAFPNRGSVTGRSGGVQGPTQGDTTADTGVNLGAPTPMSAIGIALGAVNGAVNLDVVLSQLERSGQGRLLSTPRVSTQNNVEAEMTQGVQIPIQTVSNNTVTVSFKDAALTLRVTPQITAANTIIMRVFLENASPDFSRSVNNIPPIDTQRAVTTVLVADGETTVIGGIYISREQATEGRVPLLHRIPLLGWLFKRDEMSDESRELLIFITPRITRS